jgi:eukaryotic-like serine/threonine-protein kinase
MTDTARPSDSGSGGTDAAPGVLLAERYRLQERIGRGAAGEVWAAMDESLRRPVAVKLASPEAGAAGAAHLRAEAAAAGRITHPAVVAVYDMCQTGCGEALILELVEGATLRHELDRRGPLPVPEALRIGAGICRALDAVHGAGLVHRDVKPGNVLLVEDRVKLADFGAAEQTGTRAGSRVTGTPKYVAPEQLGGGPVDHRADLYAVGVVLHEMLAGHVPFVGADDAATARIRLEQAPPSLLELRPDVGPAVAGLVLALLAQEPDGRPSSAAATARRLDDLASSWRPPVAGATEDPVPTGQWVPLVAFVLVSLCAAAVAVLLFLDVVADDGELLTVTPTTTPEEVARPDDQSLFPTAGPVGRVLGVEATDPFGDGVEHDDELARVLDGDPDTAWSTERYRTPAFGGLKPGLGVVVRVDADVAGLRVRSTVDGWSATVHQAPDADPDEPDSWGEPIDLVAAAGAEVELRLAPGGGDVLLWFTSLGGPAGEHEARIATIDAVP